MTTLDTMRIDDESPAMIDVWSRTTSKYRVRSITLLIVNIVVFAGLCCFAFWVREGTLLAPAVEGYKHLLWQTFYSVGGDATLANFVLFPIRVDLVPMHGVVVGLMLAALVSVPILIAILYRFYSSIPFILAVAFLGVMPWLAITLLGACLLAGVRRLRFRFRYASALLGLLLVLVYFYGASRQTPEVIDKFPPQDRLVFIGPWVLATIASCLMMGAVLALAKWVNYRPGVVAPTLLTAFVIPIILFAQYVGPDELYYRLIERRMKERFAAKDLTDWFDQTAMEAWLALPPPRPEFEKYRQRVDLRMQFEMDTHLSVENAVAQDLAEAISECDWFIERFPGSIYAPNVLYLKAMAMDTRVDRVAFAKRKELRYYDDFPADRSKHTWEMVEYNAGQSKMAVVAAYKLAQLAARHGRFDEAKQRLNALIHESEQTDQNRSDKPSVAGMLDRKRPEDSLDIPDQQIVRQAERLLALLETNADDPRYGNRPLCGSQPGEKLQFGLLQLDPRDPNYLNNLNRIVAEDGYKYCLLADNICLKAALLEPDARRQVRQLEHCLQEYRNGDARAETLFRLALAQQEAGQPRAARQTLEAMLQAFPNDPFWSDAARDRLQSISPVKPEGP